MQYDISLPRELEVFILTQMPLAPYGMCKDFELVTYMGYTTVGLACSKDVPQKKHKTNSRRKSREVKFC